MHQYDQKLSFVRILAGDGKSKKPVGAGFLVTPTHVITCAHVVADALGIERNTFEKPTQMVRLDFPLLEHQPGVKASVVKWFPIKENAVTGTLEDIAVLEVVPDPSFPGKIAPVPVVLLESHIFFDRSVRMCGFPPGADEGTYVNGTLQGPTGKGWIEIHHDLSGGMVQEGFSGTAVWDKKENAVSGMIVSTGSHSGEKMAYMIPIESLIRAFPELEGHSRPPNPYKGLEVFHEKDAPFFFGRGRVIESLSEIVQRQPFVAVIGASGSGKSSLILAGLIPKLKASGKWLVRDFRPKDAPFYNLSLALIPLLYKDKLEQLEKAKELKEKFRQGKIGINDMMGMMVREHPGQQFLLVVDQFEELFTANTDKSVQQRFLDLLLEPLTVSSLPFTFLFTIRADFMSQAVGYGPFAHALDRYKPKILSSMNENELTAVIEKPAEKLGVKLEPGLTQRMLQDIGNEPGNLPLLEFALTRLWEKQHFKTMTHAAYETGGGVKQALAAHADRVFAGFSVEERQRFRQIFIQLVRPGEGTEDTRQLALSNQFSEKKWNFIKRIADERLVVTGRNEESGQETVEVVHEALIKNWKPLREWIDEDRSFRVWQNNLRQAIADWKQAEKDDGALLRGVRLTDAEEKLQQRKDELGKEEITFIQASLSLREKEIAAKERQKLEKEKLRKRIRAIGFAAFMVLLIIMSMWVWRENIQEKKLEEKLIEARHNLGYVFYEKAERALESKNFNAARLYALHALANFAPNRDGPGKAAGIIISNPDYPILFSSPDGSHHDGPVNSVCLSPDGKTLASGAYDKTIRLWDVETGKEKAVLTGHTDGVNSVSFSPDGKTLASGAYDKTIRLWNLETGKEKAVLTGHTETVNSVSFSPDAKTLASSGLYDKTIRLWDVETGKEKTVLTGHTETVKSVNFSPGGKTLASGSYDKTIRLWDVETGKEKFVLTGHTDGVNSVSFSPDSKTLASGAYDKTIRLWDVETGKQKAVLTGHTKTVNSVSFSPDGKTLASGSDDKTIRLWDVETGIGKAVFTGHTSIVNSVGFSPDGKTLASGSSDNTIHLWTLALGSGDKINPAWALFSRSGDKTIHLWDVGMGTVKEKERPIGHTNYVNSVSFSPDSKTLASGSYDRTIRLWDVKTGKQKFVLTGHTGSINSVSFSPDSKTLASGSSDKTIRLWDVEAGKEKAVLTGHTSSVNSVNFSPDGKTLVSGSDDKTIRLWDVEAGKEKAVLNGHADTVKSVSFSPDGKTLASSSIDTTIRLWDVEAGKEKAVLTGHTETVKSVSFSPDGKTMASGSFDTTIRLWNLETRKEKAVLTGHTFIVSSVSFSPDGKMLISGSNDKTIRLWDVKTGKEKAVLTGHTGYVNSVSFSPNSKMLASGSDDKTIRLWDVETRKYKFLLTGQRNWVMSVSLSPDSKTLASGAGRLFGRADKPLRLLDLETGQEKAVLTGHTNTITSLNFSTDSKILASGSDDKTIRLWDLDTGKEKAKLIGHTGYAGSMSFSQDSKTLASGSYDKTIRLWDVKTGKQKFVLTGHTWSINSVSFSLDGKTLASGSDDKTIRLWDVETGKEKSVLTGHMDSVNSVSFSPDGKTLASGSDDKTIRLWDVETGKEKYMLTEPTGPVKGVSFSLDSKTLVSGAYVSRVTIRLWDVETGQEKAVLTRHTGPVFCVSFSPDSKTLAAGSFGSTIHLWDLSFLYDKRPIEEKIKEAEQTYNLELINLKLQPIRPKRNLYSVKSQPPKLLKQ